MYSWRHHDVTRFLSPDLLPMRSSSRDALRQAVSLTSMWSVSQSSTWSPSVKTSVALRQDTVSTLTIDYFICIIDSILLDSVDCVLLIDSFPSVMSHIGRARREMVRPVPVLCRVWWAISHECLSLLRLPTPLQKGWGLGLRPRCRGFPAFQGVRADVGLPSNT